MLLMLIRGTGQASGGCQHSLLFFNILLSSVTTAFCFCENQDNIEISL